MITAIVAGGSLGVPDLPSVVLGGTLASTLINYRCAMC
jgi:hypothetical protein